MATLSSAVKTASADDNEGSAKQMNRAPQTRNSASNPQQGAEDLIDEDLSWHELNACVGESEDGEQLLAEEGGAQPLREEEAGVAQTGEKAARACEEVARALQEVVQAREEAARARAEAAQARAEAAAVARAREEAAAAARAREQAAAAARAREEAAAAARAHEQAVAEMKRQLAAAEEARKQAAEARAAEDERMASAQREWEAKTERLLAAEREKAEAAQQHQFRAYQQRAVQSGSWAQAMNEACFEPHEFTAVAHGGSAEKMSPPQSLHEVELVAARKLLAQAEKDRATATLRAAYDSKEVSDWDTVVQLRAQLAESERRARAAEAKGQEVENIRAEHNVLGVVSSPTVSGASPWINALQPQVPSHLAYNSNMGYPAVMGCSHPTFMGDHSAIRGFQSTGVNMSAMGNMVGGVPSDMSGGGAMTQAPFGVHPSFNMLSNCGLPRNKVELSLRKQLAGLKAAQAMDPRATRAEMIARLEVELDFM